MQLIGVGLRPWTSQGTEDRQVACQVATIVLHAEAIAVGRT
jgi:hypothetical protein